MIEINNLKIKKILKNISFIIIYVILSVLFIYQMVKSGAINNGDDAYFHVERILEIRESLKVGNPLPYLYSYTNGRMGYPLGIFYPEITLIPIATISFLFKNIVTGIYVGIAGYTFLTFIIFHFVIKKMGISNRAAVIGAILYTFSTYRTIDAFTRFAMGEYLAMTFLPLAFFGFYSILHGEYKEWKYLSIGMIGILLSHVLSAFIVALCIAVIFLFLIYFLNEKLKIIKSMILSVIVSILGSLIFLVPFIEQLMFQKYNRPATVDVFEKVANLDSLFTYGVNNSMIQIESGGVYSVGISLILVMFAGVFYWKRVTNQDRLIYLIGIINFICASKIFPWFLLQNTPVSVVQFPFRFLMISTLCLSIYAAKLSEQIKFTQDGYKYCSVLILVILFFGSWVSSVHTLLQTKYYQESWGSYYNWGTPFSRGKFFNVNSNNDQYTPKITLGSLTDLQKHIGTVNGKKQKMVVKSKPNQQIIEIPNVNENEKVTLPISYYKNYEVYQGNKKINVDKSDDGRINLILDKINKKVSVRYHYSVIDKISYVISIVTWITLLLSLIGWTKLFKNKVG